MSTRRATSTLPGHRRISDWTNGAATFAATLWLGNWAAMHLEPDHGLYFLALAGAFLITTLSPRARRRH